MQLSSKAGPVVLKPLTNVHSLFWHSSFQHLTHALLKSPGTNTTVTTTSNLVPLLTSCYLVMVTGSHHCPVSVSPSPLCSSRAAAVPCTFLLRERGSAAALLRLSSLPASSFLLGKMSGQPPAPWAGSPGTGLPGAGSWEAPSWRGARAKEGVQASLCSAASDVKQSQAWEEQFKSGEDFFPFLHHHAQPTPSSSNDLPKELNTIQRLALSRHFLLAAACETFKYQQ